MSILSAIVLIYVAFRLNSIWEQRRLGKEKWRSQRHTESREIKPQLFLCEDLSIPSQPFKLIYHVFLYFDIPTSEKKRSFCDTFSPANESELSPSGGSIQWRRAGCGGRVTCWPAASEGQQHTPTTHTVDYQQARGSPRPQPASLKNLFFAMHMGWNCNLSQV